MIKKLKSFSRKVLLSNHKDKKGTLARVRMQVEKAFLSIQKCHSQNTTAFPASPPQAVMLSKPKLVSLFLQIQ